MSEEKFQKQYKKLNPRQKKAVDSIEGPVMVIAGPGTGKTTVLTLRIAQILRKTDTPASGILAITYTEAGVKAMRLKLREIIGSRADDVRIHTFHSFAVSVIRDFPDHFPHLSNAEPATEIESRSFIEKILEEKVFADLRPTGRPDMYVGPILGAVSESKREAHTPEMIKVFAEEEIKRIEGDESEYSTRGATKGELKAEAKKKIERLKKTILFASVYEKYEEFKKEARKIDFDDMIFEVKLALRKDELLLRLLQEEFLYLLIDEHQDTNDSQNDLILMIAEFFETPNVFIVGDEKQAIYRFQGASVENFLRFKEIWRNVELIQLDTNYRSHQKILDAGFKLIENNYLEGEHQDLRVELRAGNPDEEKPIAVLKGESITDTEEYLVSGIKKLLEETSEEEEIALIVRTNSAVGRLKRLLESAGVSASSVRNVGIFEHPVGKLFFDLLSAVSNPLDSGALGKTIAGGLWDLSFEEKLNALKEVRRMEQIKEGKIGEKLESFRESLLSGDPLGFLFEVAEESGYLEKISLEPERVEVWRGIVEFAETILRSRDNSSDTAALTEELISYRELSDQKQVKVVSGDSSARVKIMTAHGSKGLEFDYVFLPYATESFWLKKPRPSLFALPFKETSKEESVKDSRRLFYVALTRTKKHAEILVHLKLEGDEIDLPLRFIDELGAENMEIKELPKASKPVLPKAKPRISRTKESYLNAAKRLLTEKGLSVTALNHFLDCPNSFLFKSVLKLPELPSAVSEKGTALHNALALAFKSKEKDIGKLQKLVEKNTFEHLDNSFLKKVEVDNLKEDLKDEIPKMVEGLKWLFETSGRVRVEKSAVGEVEVVVSEKEKVSVPIHGRLDLVIEKEEEVEVCDYKSRKAMSENAIKGETKSASRRTGGGYFRQLVFYTLLLSQNLDYKGKVISPSLVFLTPDEKGRVKSVTLPVSDEDLKSLKGDIQTLAESIYSGEILEIKCDDEKCDWCDLRQIGDL